MSGFYIGVDGKARKVKGGYIGIDGVARKIKKGYIGVDGVARLCWSDVDPVFANNTWEGIAWACQSGEVPETWRVGDQKPMTIGGTEYTIDIIGKNHDDYADGSGKAPLTFQLHECYAHFYNMNKDHTNVGGWRDSLMRNTHLRQNIFYTMPNEVQTAIKEVVKTSAGVNTADKLFLLSETEVFNTSEMACNIEGKQYAYYANGGTAEKHKIGESNGLTWSLRSPARDVNSFVLVLADGSGVRFAYANGGYGVSFAFCF